MRRCARRVETAPKELRSEDRTIVWMPFEKVKETPDKGDCWRGSALSQIGDGAQTWKVLPPSETRHIWDGAPLLKRGDGGARELH